MMNTVFTYRYRDAGNYKNEGRVIFKDTAPNALARLNAAFDQTEFFIADQIHIPEVFLWTVGGYKVSESDHCWHEFDEILSTEDAPTDSRGRSFEEFLTEVEAASKAGWLIFDPAERQDSGE